MARTRATTAPSGHRSTEAPPVDFLCIGVQKGGTTWLWNMLRQHPQTWIPPVKEVHHFNRMHLGEKIPQMWERLRQRLEKERDGLRGRWWSAASRTRHAQLQKVLDGLDAMDAQWYRDLFALAPAGRVRGEFTPHYCHLPPAGIEDILGMAPDVRLVMMIRDPRARMVSSLSMAMLNKPEVSAARLLERKAFQIRGGYSDFVPQWQARVGAGQLIYVPFGRVRTDPRGVLAEVAAHIGLDPFDGYKDIAKVVNSQTRKVEVPPEVLDRIDELAAPQRAFLDDWFGAEFTARI